MIPEELELYKHNIIVTEWSNKNPDDINLRYAHPTINVLTRSGELLDDRQSDEPELVIIPATVNVLGNAYYQLLNENGWYCLLSNVSVLSRTNIDLGCETNFRHLNVSVFSKVEINRQCQ